jgi:hypothetical protein
MEYNKTKIREEVTKEVQELINKKEDVKIIGEKVRKVVLKFKGTPLDIAIEIIEIIKNNSFLLNNYLNEYNNEFRNRKKYLAEIITYQIIKAKGTILDISQGIGEIFKIIPISYYHMGQLAAKLIEYIVKKLNLKLELDSEIRCRITARNYN